MESESLRIKTVLVSVLRSIICTGKMTGIDPQGGQTQKVPRPQKFSIPNFGGHFEVDIPTTLHVVCHDILYQNVRKNVGQSTAGSHKVKNSKF